MRGKKEDESMASEAPKNRPADSAFKQQRLKAWQPILTPYSVIGIFTIIGVAFIPLGAFLLGVSNSVKEMHVTYATSDDVNWCDGNCARGSENQEYQNVNLSETKEVVFHLEGEWDPPVYVYYQLDNFYQNHRRYVKSRSDDQLRGKEPSVQVDVELNGKYERQQKLYEKLNGDIQPVVSAYTSSCSPLVLPAKVSNTCKGPPTNQTGKERPCKVMWPCGLVAGSFFDDFYLPVNSSLSGLEWSEKNIAWQSDIDIKFKNPEWYEEDLNRGENSLYYHLAQRYPHFPNLAKEGVENEHFIVWMRTAGLPTFRKLYAKIGEEGGKKLSGSLKIEVHSHFDVSEFNGKKSLVLSQTSWMGGKNPFLGIAYIVVGAISLILGVVFLAVHLKFPRKLGDTTYLVFKSN